MKQANVVAGIVCVVAFAFAAQPAWALGGVVSGTVTFDDDRLETSGDTGSLHVSGGTTDPLRQVRVKVIKGTNTNLGEGTTGDNGAFSFAWSDSSMFSFPSSGFKLQVVLQDPSDFQIKDEGGAIFAQNFNITITSTSQALGSFSVGDDEEVQVYASAIDFWQRVVDLSATLYGRMTNVSIYAGIADTTTFGCGAGSSCTTDRNTVVLVDGRGVTRPVTSVAHELGHASTGQALEWDIGYPGTCDVPHTYTSNEDCEKVAWHEGIANFWGTVFSWSHNAADSVVVFGSSFNTVGTVHSSCIGVGAAGWDTEGCITAAMWDFFDDPSSDDDLIDDSETAISVSHVADILNAYAIGTGNRQNAESGSHGTNHWDFLKNLDDTSSASIETGMRAIYLACNLSGGEEIY